jgi:hypothetical protein
MKISIPKKEQTPSPQKRGRTMNDGRSQSPEKKGFPTTPRSIEKQKKILGAKLKKAMDDNIRLHAHNRCLKETNTNLMDTFAQKDKVYQTHKQLNSNARREINFKQIYFEKIRDNIMNLDPRERFQEANLKGLVKYAKKMTVELEEQKSKVVMSE